jgi:hypothetical protein
MRGSSRSLKCEREGKMHDMCGVHYRGALLLSQVAGLPMSAFGQQQTKSDLARDGLSASDPNRAYKEE